jgi:uncharacterized membrane protein
MAAKTSGTGLSRNTSAALSYVLGPLTGVVFLVLEKDSYVRFHAMQSIVTFIGLFALQWALGLSVILIFLVPIVGLVGFILWLLLIYKAWQGDEWSVPFAGNLARKLLTKK